MAQESTWVLLISEEALRSMMQMDFRVTENYLRYLTARIRFLSGRLDGFLPQSVETRKQHINKQKRAPPPIKGRDALTKLHYCLQVHHKYLVFVTKYRLNNRFGSCIRR